MALPCVVVEEEIADALVAELVRLCRAQKVGPAYDKATRLGPVGSLSHRKFITDWIEKGVARARSWCSTGAACRCRAMRAAITWATRSSTT